MTKVRYIGENRDGTALLEVALNGECKADDLFVCDVEQLSVYHSYGKESFIKAATTTRNKWVRLLGASTTRSMSKSSECANSATDNITQSPFLLRSITTTLSEVPVSLSFGTVPCGADRVSVKNQSENSDCALCSVTELVGLPDVAMEKVFAEVKKRTGGEAQYDLGYISTKNAVSAWLG